MKPGSIAMAGYTKDSIPLARRFIRFCSLCSLVRQGRMAQQR